MIRVEINRPFEFLETAGHVTKEMTDLKTDRGMDRVNLVSFLPAGREHRSANGSAEEQEK